MTTVVVVSRYFKTKNDKEHQTRSSERRGGGGVEFKEPTYWWLVGN